MKTAPIILVPGFWLGAWAWDEVAATLRADGHDVTALTLPGLVAVETERTAITLDDTFRRGSVPDPGAALRDNPRLTNEASRDIPSTIICTGYPAADHATWLSKDRAFRSGIPELRNLTWVDLPTSHWPMWSRPGDLAALLGGIATAHAHA